MVRRAVRGRCRAASRRAGVERVFQAGIAAGVAQHGVRALAEHTHVQRRRRRHSGGEGHAALEQMLLRWHVAVVAEWHADECVQMLHHACTLGPGGNAAKATVQVIEGATLAQHHHFQRLQPLHGDLQRRGRSVRCQRGRGELLQGLGAYRRRLPQAARAHLQQRAERTRQRLRGLVAHCQRYVGNAAAWLAEQMHGLAQAQAGGGLAQRFPGQRAVDPVEVMRRLMRHRGQRGEIRQRAACADAVLQMGHDTFDVAVAVRGGCFMHGRVLVCAPSIAEHAGVCGPDLAQHANPQRAQPRAGNA